MLVYITGPAGAGKSTLCEALVQHGIEAHDLDAPHLGGAYHLARDERVEAPLPEHRDSYWFSQHEWRIEVEAVRGLKEKSKDQLIVICGVAERDDDILSLFDTILYLDISRETLLERLKKRQDNDFGKTEVERQLILQRKLKLDTKYADDSRVQRINSEQALPDMIEQVLQAVSKLASE